MTCETSVTPSAVWPRYGGRACRTGNLGLLSAVGFGLTVLAPLAGGCGGGNFMALSSSEEFQQQVLQAEKPVMVHFFKSGCSRCTLLEQAMDRMVNDYRDRAVFAKYCLTNIFWIVTNKELKKQYDIRMYPTVVLFVDGQEKMRWVMHYDIESYRKALDEALGIPTAPMQPASGKT